MAPQRSGVPERPRSLDEAGPSREVARVWGIPIHSIKGMSSDSVNWFAKTLRELARKNQVETDEYGDIPNLKREHVNCQTAVRKAKFELSAALQEYWARIQALNRSTEWAARAKREYDRETVWQLMLKFGTGPDGKRYVPKRRLKSPEKDTEERSDDSDDGKRKRKRK
jgi:hypothetical protein